MVAAFLIGIPSSFTTSGELVSWARPWGVQPIHLAFWLLAIGAIYTAITQAIRINRFEKGKPRLQASLLSFPLSGYRIVRKS